MIKIIINADDYGLNENVTMAIAKCMREKVITNASLMVNMPYTESAVRIAKENGFADRLGLHVNLTEGVPLTSKITKYKDFCDSEGCFNKQFDTIVQQFYLISPNKRKAIREEIEAQFERYLALGFKPGHFDSHNYVHCRWNLIPIILPIAKRYGFKTMRRPLTIAPFKRGFSKMLYSAQFDRMKKYGFKMTQHFGAFINVEKHVRQRLVITDSVELMVHPMYVKDGQQDMLGEMRDSCYCSMEEVVKFVKDMSETENTFDSFTMFANVEG